MRLEQAGQDQRQLLLAAAGGAGDREPGRQRQLEAQPLDDRLLALLGDSEVLRPQRCLEVEILRRVVALAALVDQARRCELGDRLLILDLNVVHGLIVGEQLLPRRRQVLVRADDGDQRTQRDLAMDHEVAADGEEEEGPELGDEVVEELDQELLLVDVKADPEHLAQLFGEAGQLIGGGVVGADVAHPRCGLADALGVAPHLAHPALAQIVHLPLQLGDQPHLDRVEGDGSEAQHHVLHEDEEQDGDQRAALERRHGQGVADIAAQGLGLGVDHLHQLALAHPAECRQREAQDVAEEIVAQPPQHPLGDDPGIDVEDVFEHAADQHQRQEDAAQRVEVVHLVELVAEDRVRIIGPAQRLVDDDLRQLERIVERGEGQQRQHEDDELLPPAVLADIGEDRWFHRRAVSLRSACRPA